jgi:hypothetical protein
VTAGVTQVINSDGAPAGWSWSGTTSTLIQLVTINATTGAYSWTGVTATITGLDNTPQKQGGDDVPRIEIWTFKKKKKELEKIVREVAKAEIATPVPKEVIEAIALAIRGQITTKQEIVAQIDAMMDDEDDIEALLLLL